MKTIRLYKEQGSRIDDSYQTARIVTGYYGDDKTYTALCLYSGNNKSFKTLKGAEKYMKKIGY